MDLYSVELTKSAAKDIKKLQRQDQQKVVDKLEELSETPRPRGVEKLKENPSFFRVKVGRDLRLVYMVEDAKRLIIVALVRDRKDAYRGVSDLDPVQIMANVESFREQLQAPPGSSN